MWELIMNDSKKLLSEVPAHEGALEHSPVQLRPARFADWPLVLDLTNQEFARQMLRLGKPLSCEDFRWWFAENYQYYLLINENQGAAWVKDGEVTVLLFPQYQSEGLGCDVIAEMLKRYPTLRATVHLENIQAIRCFVKAGFAPVSVTLEGSSPDQRAASQADDGKATFPF